MKVISVRCWVFNSRLEKKPEVNEFGGEIPATETPGSFPMVFVGSRELLWAAVAG